jgi:hypothetical protein
MWLVVTLLAPRSLKSSRLASMIRSRFPTRVVLRLG